MNVRLCAAAALAALVSSTSPPAQNASPPDLLPAPAGGLLGPGPQHKLRIPADDSEVLARVRARGAVRELDYGAFVVAVVDEDEWGGRAALAQSGLPLRDDYDLVALNGYALDGTRPDETLNALPSTQVLGSGAAGALDPDAGLYLVQFAGPPRDEWVAAVDALGARFRQYQPMNAYVVRLRPERVWELDALAAAMPEIQYVGEYQPAFRMTPAIRRSIDERIGQAVPVTIQLVEDDGMRATLDVIRLMAARFVDHQRVSPYVNVHVDLDPAYFEALALDPFVFAIEERGVLTETDERQGQILAGNLSGSAPSSPGYLAWLGSLGFDSSQFGSFSVNVVDDATSLSGHPDLASGRVDFQLNPTSQGGTQGGHGFLNAHIVAGLNSGTGSAFEDGSGYNYGLGIAPWAHVGATAIFGPGSLNPSSYESSAYQQGARISTNSWSFETSGGAPIPDYDSWSQTYDVIARDARSSVGGNQEYLIVFSAGNDGPGSNSISTPGTAKNMITVGASENVRTTGTDGCGVPNSGANNANDIISFSSRGPINATGGDGRWKPEIVGPGTHIQAGVPQSNYNGTTVCNQYWPSGQTLYGWSSGTSHATPAVAGGAALVRQWFLNQSMAAPSPAMVKAVLSGTSAYMTGTGANDTLPSNSQGMGRMDLGRSFDALPKLTVDQTDVLASTGASYVLGGVVADSGNPFRVVLAWTDAPGSTSGAPWVNDLDLSVSVGGTTYRGNVFAGASSAAGGSADFRNNLESVFLPSGASGSFTVTVTGAAIAGDGVPGNGDSTDQDFALYVYNGTTAGAGPVAAFTGTPTTGLVPLAVTFADQSIGNVTSWSWDFGDSGTSSLQSPAHTYTASGTYTVTLTVDGPDGMDTETKVAYVTVSDPPPPGVTDGSFESQSAGTAPVTPWAVTFGTGHVVNPAGATSDNGMPTHGTQWCEIAADSTNGATPPSNPGGVTTPPIGGAGVSQTFTYPTGQSVLEFEAAFLRNENANDSTYNDWMSVDVSDGSTTYNLYYKDTFSGTSGTSSKYGYAMTAVETVSADLAVLFPGSTPATTFTLTAQAGNGEDNVQPSKGYVDDFRLLAPAGAPVAEFSGTPTSGAPPLMVDFTDASTGNVTGWLWDFGDGGSSFAQNPIHNYTAPGTYTVTLTASGPGGSDGETKVGYITVAEPPPVAEFSGTPTSGTAPLSVDFADASTGNVTGWLWDFGDGGSSFAQNPIHNYTAPGTYTVTLTASGPGGSDGETKVGYITVAEPPPVAAFSGTPTSGTAPLTVDFIDASTGNVTGWLWDFGDGGSSFAQSPGHNYTAPGTYTVTLTATGPGGSDDETKVGYITVADPPPVAEFSGSPTSGIAPLTVDFADASTGNVTGWAWDFGDTNTSTTQSPSHTYTTPGVYTVTLTASGPGGSDGETKVGYITVGDPPPVAAFSGTPTSGIAPLTVNFTDASTGNVTGWAWDFGDTNSSNLQSPIHTYTTPGTYTVTLTATGPGGSDGEIKVGYVTVGDPPPVAGFSGTPTSGIAPLTVDFIDASTGNVTGWLWDFGDTNTSNLQSPSHTYTTPGSYTVTLTASGPGGSDGETEVGYVTVGDPPPIAGFSGTPTSGIAPLTVDFTDESTGSVTGWLWDFGDTNSSNLQSPSHTYTTPGTYTVTLTASGPGGSDGETKVGYVTVGDPPPVAGFSGTPTSGIAPLTVDFADASTGNVTGWLWDFGDTNTSTTQSPSRTYITPGTYTVTLTASGPGGSDGETKVGYITVADPPPVAAFSGSPTSGIAPLNVDFADASTGNVTGWAWDFGDTNSSSLQSPSHTYTTPGVYTVTLTASGPGGADGETKVGYVTVGDPPPVAGFSGTPTSGIAPLTVDFIDESTGNVTGWLWDFGDTNTSNLQSPSHTYTTPGTYTVTLTASGPGGSDGETKVDYVTVSPFVTYCTAKTNSQGCVPQIAASGLPSASDSNPFDVTASMVLNQRNGLLFYGLSGRSALPFLGGTLCVQPALRRLAIQNAGGTAPPVTDCSGNFTFDFNAHVQGGTDPLLLPGQQVNAQYWSRDPAHLDGSGVGLTDAVEFVVGS